MAPGKDPGPKTLTFSKRFIFSSTGESGENKSGGGASAADVRSAGGCASVLMESFNEGVEFRKGDTCC